MRRLMFTVVVLVLIANLVGCARTKRIANDIDWMVFDGQPMEDN